MVDPNDPTPSLLEQTRQQEVGEVPPEPVPGLIDQRLFGAFVPKDLPSEPMPDLEASAAVDIQVEVETMPGLENTMQDEVPGQAPIFDTSQPIPGFIDSRLFGAYMPPNIETPTMEGVEHTLFEGDADLRKRSIEEPSRKDEAPIRVCLGCGVEERVELCPNCGERMRPKTVG